MCWMVPGFCASVGGAGVGVGAGLVVTLAIGLKAVDKVDIGATTDPVPTLVAELKRFAPADISPDAPLPIKSITPLIESLLSPSWACSAVTPAVVVACSAGPCGASCAAIAAILVCIPAATAPAAASTGEPGLGIGAAAGGGVAECSTCATTVEAADSSDPGCTATVLSAITHRPLSHADHLTAT